MMDVSPTRMELLKLRQKKKLALKGQKLLKNKQDALIMNFFEKVKELKELQKDLSDKLGEAYKALRIAQALDGYSNVTSAAYNAPTDVEMKTETLNIMGVKVPHLILSMKEDKERFYASNQLMDARERFTKALLIVTKIAEVENAVRKLAEEIKKTKRMLNSLEQRMIPSLNQTINYVKMTLAEVERESFFRLKIVKQRLENEA